MKNITFAGLLIVVAMLSGDRPRAAGCDPIGKIQFVCDIISARTLRSCRDRHGC
jgi:hypothetical protein